MCFFIPWWFWIWGPRGWNPSSPVWHLSSLAQAITSTKGPKKDKSELFWPFLMTKPLNHLVCNLRTCDKPGSGRKTMVDTKSIWTNCNYFILLPYHTRLIDIVLWRVWLCMTFDVGWSIVHSRQRHSEVSQGIVKAAKRLNDLQAAGLEEIEWRCVHIFLFMSICIYIYIYIHTYIHAYN